MEIKGKKIAVLGLADAGKNIAKYLLKAGAMVTAFGYLTDEDKAKTEKELKSAHGTVVFGPIPEDGLKSFDAVVLAPFSGTYLEAFDYAKKHGIPAYNDLDFACQFLKGKIIGITGTCGKSTTAGLIQEMLKDNGHKSLLLGGESVEWGSLISNNKYDFFVVEVSSSRLQRASLFHPHIAVLLNIYHAHSDRQKFADYVETKAKIFARQNPEDFLVYDAEAENLQELIRNKLVKAQLVKTSLHSKIEPPGVYHDQSNLIWVDSSGGMQSYSLKNSRINTFPTRMMDAMAAIAVAQLCGVKPEKIQKALDNFKSLPGRLTRIRKLDRVMYVDDSHSNNIGAAIWALNSFSRPIIWIVGGKMIEGSRLNKIPRYVSGKIKKCIVVGSNAPEIAEVLKDMAPVIQAVEMRKAVEIAQQEAEGGEVVLFSPALPPDQIHHDSGASRAEAFREAVLGLSRKPTLFQQRGAFTRI